MKRIVIITYTNSDNYGTVLQAYATYRLFEEMFPEYEVVIANTDDVKSAVRRVLALFKAKRIGQKNYRWYNFLQMRKFIKTTVKRSKLLFTNHYDKAARKLQALDADCYIVGSDEIWKGASKKTPDVYFIPPQIRAYKACFAASANRIDYEAMEETDVAWIKEVIAGYNRIAVRDENTEQFVHRMNPEAACVQVIDPTFCCDFPQVTLSKELAAVFSGEKKTVALMIKNKALVKRLKEQLGDDYRLYSIYGYHEGIPLLPMTPLEFANCLGRFDCVVTEYFHGTCFSIRNNAQFLSIDTEEIYRTYESKIKNLLRKLELMDRYMDLTKTIDEERLGILVGRIKALTACEEKPQYEGKTAPFVEATKAYLREIRNDLMVRNDG